MGVCPLPAAHPISVSTLCTTWPLVRSTYSTLAMPARVAMANTAPVGTVRIQSWPTRSRSSRSMHSPGHRTSRLPAWMAMVCSSRCSGAGQDLVSTFLIPRAISVTQGWCRVMAYIQFNGAGDRYRGLTSAPGTASAIRQGTAALRNGGWANQTAFQMRKHHCDFPDL